MSSRASVPSRRTLGRALVLAAALGIALQWPVAGQGQEDPISCPTSRAQASLDRVGTAMLLWLTDVVSGLHSAPTPEGSTCVGAVHVDVTLVPTIPVADLRALLVPFYISSIPANDPWGTPYDYRLNVADPLSAYAIALRSAGAEGLFEGTTYIGGATSGPDEDLVSYNGFRVREPPRLDSVGRQAKTVEQIDRLGSAMLSWLTDVVSSASRAPQGGPTVDLSLITPVSAADLAALLSPFYIQCVPEQDGWGGPFDLRLNDNFLTSPIMSIRSSGRDGVVEGEIYDTETFPADDFARDLVWSDGTTYRAPSTTRATIFTDDFESATLWGTWSCGPGF